LYGPQRVYCPAGFVIDPREKEFPFTQPVMDSDSMNSGDQAKLADLAHIDEIHILDEVHEHPAFLGCTRLITAIISEIEEHFDRKASAPKPSAVSR